MNNPFERRKQKAEEKARQEAAAHQQRLNRLQQLEADLAAQEGKKGLRLPHPIKKRKAQKEIKTLQKEVAAYNSKQSKRKKDKKPAVPPNHQE